MAQATEALEIRNEIPLSISISNKRIFKPLEVAAYEPGVVAKLTFLVPQMGGSDFWIFKSSLPPIVTIDYATLLRTISANHSTHIQQFLKDLPTLKEQGSNELRVTNDTWYLAEAWLLDRTGPRLMGRIGPHGTWQHPARPFQIWHFRTLSGLTLDMWAHPHPELEPERLPPFHVKITTGFMDAWRAYQQRPVQSKDKRGLGPLRLIGERRASTPGKDDQLFISASTVRVDISKEPFNGLENREVRDVEIAGSFLRWSGSNRILSGYYGQNNAADIRSLSIFCDRMEVADRLHFPRTNVTIYARELVFTGSGRIDTTPLPYPGRAESEYLVEDPNDPIDATAGTKPKVPATASGTPTYKARDGRKGEPAGNVTLHVEEARFIDDGLRERWPGDPHIRFILEGGKGQQGEAGGLEGYVPGDGRPAKYGPLAVITPDTVARLFEEKTKLKCWQFRWPGDVDGPGKITNWPGQNGESVVSVSIFAIDVWGTWLRKLYLPSNADWNKSINQADMIDTNNSVKGCLGRNAYAGGWPGEGGDGGNLEIETEKDFDLASLRNAGAMGDSTLPVQGDEVRQQPVHVQLMIYSKEPRSHGTPNIWTENRSGGQGRLGPGRAAQPDPASLTPAKYSGWGPGYDKADGYKVDGYVVDLQNQFFETRLNKAKYGERRMTKRASLSWAHPAAMTAVLSYARTAFRNGFRDDAASALAPYQAAAVLQADALAQCGAEVRMAFASIVSLANNLALNVDYYGNPPGWVPRLNALSNLGALKTVRNAAYGTYYFADKMLRDAEELEDVRETAVLAKEALTAEMTVAKALLQKAYDQMPAAIDKLNAAQKLATGVEGEIVALRKEAIALSVDKVMVQRFVSAALQMVDGVAKALPVGQPFLGLAGSVFGAAAKIDWNAEKPLETGSAAIAHLSGQVSTFVADKGEAVAMTVTGELHGRATASESLVTQLTREQEDTAKAPAEAVVAAEVKWQDLKSAELLQVEQQIKVTTDAITAIKAAKSDDPDAQTASDFLSALNKQRELLARKQMAPLQKELVDYRKQQFELINRAQLVAKIQNDALKAQAAKTSSADVPPTLAEKLTAATRRSEDQKALIARKEATAKKTMTQLEGLGTGLALVGDAIISAATPITDDDPTVQRLADRMLVENEALRAAGQRFTKQLKACLAEKQLAVSDLMRWQKQATTSLATVTRNLATMSELSKQRQSIDIGLNPAAKAYLKETRDAAKDILAESIYWFVKSYQYEFLRDVPDSFFNFDTWAAELQKQERTRLTEQAARAAALPAVQGAAVTRAPKILLSKEDFEAIGDGVFKAEQLKLGAALLAERQKRGPSPEGEYLDCVLQRTDQPQDPWDHRQNEMLDALEQGEAVFDFVLDFRKGSYGWNHARVAQVKLVKLDVEASESTLSLTFRVEQRGDAVIARKDAGEDRQFYRFRPSRNDDPIGWTFVYNHQKRKSGSGITTPPTPDPLGDVAGDLLNSKMTFQEYQPALFSDYVIRITDLYGADGKRKGLTTIRELAMTVFLTGG